MTDKPADKSLKPDNAVTLDYETAKRIAKDGVFHERARLAADAATSPEILFFLAADSSPSVREAAAANPSMPWAGQKLLAHDTDIAVRASIAEMLANLWPDYAVDSRTEVREAALQALEVLAIDQATRVREALASAIKDIAMSPPSVVRQLACDIAQSVAEPILRHCARLDEDVLVDLALNRRENWVQNAMAQRRHVSPRVTQAIFDSGNREATRLVLENLQADIDPATLDKIAEVARHELAWQVPLAQRPTLPRAIAVKLAEFVDIAAFEVLRTRGDFDEALAAEIVAVARRRMDWIERYGDKTPAAARALNAWRDGTLNESAVGDALSWSDHDFVIAALAMLARIEPDTVRKIMASGSARAVTALSWRAGLSMRIAMQLQRTMANIPPHKLLNARHGTDYPISETELIWYLEFFNCPQ